MAAIFSNMYMSVTVNGARTKFFRQSRSIRQGDPVAMATFVMSVEPLANLIRRDMSLSPVRIPNQPPKTVAQYCDDTTIISQSASDYQRVGNSTKIFENGSGAKLNHQKTEISLVGMWTQEDRSMLLTQNIKENVKILGIWFGKNANELNQQAILEKIDKVIDFWKDIPLSFEGKKLIIHTKMLSQLYHTIRVTGMTARLRNEVQKRITNFFWLPRKMCLIAYKTLQNRIDSGGLMLPDLDCINRALLTERIPKILKGDKPWKGHFLFRLGSSLRYGHANFGSMLHEHTNKQTPATSVIASVFRKLENDV